jgi:hypothetical protein
LIALSNAAKSEIAPLGHSDARETAVQRSDMESLPPTDHVTL